MSDMQTRTLPQSIEAEMAVLGGVFVDNEAILSVIELCRPEEFYRENHRKILNAMIKLSGKSRPIDLATMTEALKRSGELEAIGGAGYLATLIDYVPTSANIAHYCKIVKEKAHSRQVIDHAQKVVNAAYEEKDDLESYIDNLLAGSAQRAVKQPVDAVSIAKMANKRLEARWNSKGSIQGIPYGIPSLDKVTNGLSRKDLIVVAGRPSMGKTAFVCNIMENICRAGYSGMLFSLEMSEEENSDRLMTSVGNVRYGSIRSGCFEDAEWSRLAVALNKIAGFKLHIDDTPAMSLHEIHAKCYRQKKKGLDVVGIDYLQLMKLNAKENRNQAIGEVTRGLKAIAKDLDIAIIVLSQLNRGLESRTDKRPMMSDLRESGEIEQDADVILFPYRPAVYCQQCKDKVENENHSTRKHQMAAEIIIGKQRKGESQINVPLVWMAKYQRFEEIVESPK